MCNNNGLELWMIMDMLDDDDMLEDMLDDEDFDPDLLQQNSDAKKKGKDKKS